ncbi:UPF0223 family protein [Neobacillus niacini]|uniref:UPF0223 family protein n=1 Tax=Neobacillus niacini TaxID=86668 RepID=UPI003003371E
MEYQYPIDYHWTTDEIVDVIKFYEAIEKAYEKGINRDELMAIYRRFKEIVPSKAEEKTLCSEFENISGYSSYRVIKKAKDAFSGDTITMKLK